MKNDIKKVVIPVAGLGTRGLPFTKEVPKELLPILDTPTIHFIIEEVLNAGIEQVIFVTSKGKSSIEDYFDYSPNLEMWLKKRGKEKEAENVHNIGKMCEIISVRQKEPLGLGHAIMCAKNIIGNEMFAVCLGDEIFPPWDAVNQKEAPLKKLAALATKEKKSVLGVVEIDKKYSSSYGIVDLGGETLENEAKLVLRAVEKPTAEKAPSNYAIVGRYVFEPVLFDYLKEMRVGHGGEIQLTDGIDGLAKMERLLALPLAGSRYDVGNAYYYMKAQIDLALQKPELGPKLRNYLKSL